MNEHQNKWPCLLYYSKLLGYQVSMVLIKYENSRREKKNWRTEFELTTLVVIGTDYTDSCKSNYHTITTTMAPIAIEWTSCWYLICIYVTFVSFGAIGNQIWDGRLVIIPITDYLWIIIILAKRTWLIWYKGFNYIQGIVGKPQLILHSALVTHATGRGILQVMWTF